MSDRHNWREIYATSPRELVLSGGGISKQIEEEDGLNEAIFRMRTLNFMEVTRTSSLKVLPPTISQLSSLTNLVLHSNQLSSIPEQIGLLTKLKFLDLSRNLITELPSSIEKLINLQSLNVECNELTSLPPLGTLVNLLVVKFGTNQLTLFPESLCKDGANLAHLSEIHAAKNKINGIPTSISKLPALKVLDLSENEITIVPAQLGDCSKLKDVNLKGNKLKDRRLQKLIDQCHLKQIMDYIRAHCPKHTNITSNSEDNDETTKSTERTGSRETSLDRKSKLKDARRRRRSSSRSSNDGDTQKDTISVLPMKEDQWFKVIASSIVLVQRKAVAAIVRGVNLSTPGMVKKFISLQNDLHKGVCGHRQHATIATHDLGKINGNQVTFDVKPPSKIKLVPLGRHKEMSAAELYKLLKEEADAYRKEKKKNTYSGIHKYLYLLKGRNLFPCLIDESGQVISFPPLTNSEATKISDETTDILLEVTGGSVPTCKKVMEELIHGMLRIGLGGELASENNANPNNAQGDLARPLTPTSIIKPKQLQVEAVKVVDAEGKLLVQFPSRIDLVYGDEVNVIRL